MCNHCVERYDHHCPWLGVCIGNYNYKYFMMFLMFLNIVSVMATGCCIAVVIIMVQDKQPVVDYLIEIIVGIVAGGFAIGLLRLFVYHMGLTSSRLTTN